MKEIEKAMELLGVTKYRDLARELSVAENTISGVDVPNPKGYFYATAKRYGGMYPMPKGYKPLRLIHAEMVQKRRSQEAEAARIEAEIGEMPEAVKALTGWMPTSRTRPSRPRPCRWGWSCPAVCRCRRSGGL